ncbi:MAG: glycosyltransferase family A protein [Lacunisphaera sp.]
MTIVIPTRDRLHLLQECVELLDETVDWKHARLVIVDDHSRDADAVKYLAAIQQRTDLRCVVVRPADRSAPFNYSHLVNLARPHLATPLVLHLNNGRQCARGRLARGDGDVFLQSDVGVVGAPAGLSREDAQPHRHRRRPAWRAGGHAFRENAVRRDPNRVARRRARSVGRHRPRA